MRHGGPWGYPYGYSLPETYGTPHGHHPPAPPARSHSTAADYSTFTRLTHFRDSFEDDVNYRDARQRILELYTGTSADEWIIPRLIGIFDLLFGYRAGIAFTAEIYYKTARPSSDFCAAVLNHHSKLIPTETGLQLLTDIIERHKGDQAVVDCVRTIVSLFEAPTTGNYQILFEAIVKYYRSREDVVSRIYSFDWMRAPHLMLYFALALRFLPWDRMRRYVEPLVNDPLPFVRNPGFAIGYAAILQYVPDERDRMMDYLVGNVKFFAVAPESAPALRAIISLATFEQQEILLTAFEGFLREAAPARIRRDLEVALDRLLVSVGTRSRIAFMTRNQGTQFTCSVQYMEFVLSG
jgi:hypothetical protein